MKPMKRREFEKRLKKVGVHRERDVGPHSVWVCGCGNSHTTTVPRHGEVSPGVVRTTIQRLPCIPRGAIQ